MAIFYNKFKTAIHTVADVAADLLHRVLLGTPGSTLMYPSDSPDDQYTAKAYNRGELWSGIMLPNVLTPIGNELDTFMITWADITTDVFANPAVLNANRNVASVTKNTGNDSITVTFIDPYTTGQYYVNAGMVGLLSVIEITNRSVGSVTFRLWNDLAGNNPMNINERTVIVFICGRG